MTIRSETAVAKGAGAGQLACVDLVGTDSG